MILAFVVDGNGLAMCCAAGQYRYPALACFALFAVEDRITAMREIYASENGDIWHLLRDLESGHTFVRHTANEPSGGNVVDISLPVFLSLGRDGPEHEALWAMIGTLIDGSPSAGMPRQTGPEAGAAAAEPSPGEAMGSVNG